MGNKKQCKIFKLKNITTISVTKGFVLLGIFVLVYRLIILMVPYNIFLILLLLAFVIIVLFYVFRDKMVQKEITLEIINDTEFNIYFNQKLKISAPLSDLKSINTLHPTEHKKRGIQAEMIFRNNKINFSENKDTENKETFNSFVLYLENLLNMNCLKAQFSLRWSKHYVEFQNPLYSENK